jgi:cobalt-zinc-cadmium resistance protein CzcA
MQNYNKRVKGGLIKKTGTEMGKVIFFFKLIIIAALLPIFVFRKVEGKMFLRFRISKAFSYCNYWWTCNRGSANTTCIPDYILGI